MVSRSPNFDLSQFVYRTTIGLLGGLGILIMVGPVLLGLLMSFTAGETLRFPPQGLSLRWYEAILDPVRSGPLQKAAMTSLQIAVTVVIGCLFFAVPAALGSLRLPRRLAAGVDVLLLAPLVLPGLVYGLAALFAATVIGIGTSWFLVLAGHIVVFSPLLYRSTVAVASGLDRSLEEASSTLGAHYGRTLGRVTLPLILPGIVAGAFLVFMSSFDNVSLTIFLADPGTGVLPVRMWQMMEQSLDARVGAVAGLLTFATLVLVVLFQRIAPLFKERR